MNNLDFQKEYQKIVDYFVEMHNEEAVVMD
jgi:hypothetical protein